MAKPLIDLLWRDHPDAPVKGARGPRSRHSTGEVVDSALAIADAEGLDAVTIRAVAESLSMSPMSVYTHVNSRDDLLVLMADAAHGGASRPRFGRASWRTRVRRVAESNLGLVRARSWLLHLSDDRVALGPGTIAKYDHELHAFDGTGLSDIDRDAALTFVIDFARSSAAAMVRTGQRGDFADVWRESAGPLGRYVGDSYPLAQRVGRAAGEHLAAPYSAAHAWKFGIRRVIAGLSALIDTTEPAVRNTRSASSVPRRP
ncbi:MAG TPA: TetR/AcrR family transcriptional regulator C-terminal domain-containing protein [Jiangellales bacterium]|nr:TetR/AcrR family transcriptional regulator C-terminal domain-containing protein [Jiangellales bacterium]